MEAQLIKDISSTLSLSEEEVIEESISSFLDRSLRNAALELEKIKRKYNVNTSKELELKIERGELKAHPAWEEIIEWENLQKRIVEIKRWTKKLPISS